jgi:hypothetical protein
MSEATKAANRKFYERHKEAEKARTKKYRAENPEKYKDWVEKNRGRIRANSRRYEYSMSQDQFDVLMIKQDSKCAICGIILENPDVDHNHKCCSQRKTCGKCNRGLLCHGCNTIIGLAGDSIIILTNAIEYLKGYPQ